MLNLKFSFQMNKLKFKNNQALIQILVSYQLISHIYQKVKRNREYPFLSTLPIKLSSNYSFFLISNKVV